MVLTKAEAIALNLWNDIKDVLEIKENISEAVMMWSEKRHPHSSFQEDIKLWTEFPPQFKFDISVGEVLILSKKVQQRDNLSK